MQTKSRVLISVFFFFFAYVISAQNGDEKQLKNVPRRRSLVTVHRFGTVSREMSFSIATVAP